MPALHRAHPQDAAGDYRPVHRRMQVPFRDGGWHTVDVLGQARDLGGGWRVLIRWTVQSDTHEDWFLFEAAKFREPGIS